MLAGLLAGGAVAALWLRPDARGPQPLRRVMITGATFLPGYPAAISADGRRFVLGIEGAAQRAVFWRHADGTGVAEPVSAGPQIRSPSSWSADGRVLALDVTGAKTGRDVWVQEWVDGKPGEARPFVATEFDEGFGAFSPDGRFLAYVSNESGRPEVYARPYPGPAGKLQVSNVGGTGPLWSRDGRELFFNAGDGMMVVRTAGGASLSVSPAEVLFKGDFVWSRVGNYDVTPDGKRFVIARGVPGQKPTAGMHVVLGFHGMLERAAPSAR